MDYKALKKLADTCRKSGIKHYKDANFEFTLTEDAPMSNYKKKINTSSAPISSTNEKLVSEDFESLSMEEKLFWSSAQQDGAADENR